MATEESERFEAIVLAAGAGSRFGGGKLLAPWQGGVLLDGALGVALAAPVRTVRVVVGAEADRVGDAARRFAEGREAAGVLKIVHAVDHFEGMGASLRAGARDLPGDTSGVVVFLADMPRIPQGLPALLIDAVLAGSPAAAPVFEARRGHPVAFSAALIAGLREAAGDAGAREVLRGLGDRLARVETHDPGVLFDVDTAGDLDGSTKR